MKIQTNILPVFWATCGHEQDHSEKNQELSANICEGSKNKSYMHCHIHLSPAVNINDKKLTTAICHPCSFITFNSVNNVIFMPSSNITVATIQLNGSQMLQHCIYDSDNVIIVKIHIS